MIPFKQSRYFLVTLGLCVSFEVTAKVSDVEALVETLVTKTITKKWAKSIIEDNYLPNFSMVLALMLCEQRLIDAPLPKEDPAALAEKVNALKRKLPNLRAQVISALPNLLTQNSDDETKIDDADAVLARNLKITQTWVDFHLNRLSVEKHLRKALQEHLKNPSATKKDFQISDQANLILSSVAGVVDLDESGSEGNINVDDFSEFLFGEMALATLQIADSLGFTQNQAKGFVAENLLDHMYPTILTAFMEQQERLRSMVHSEGGESFEFAIIVTILANYARAIRLTVGEACIPCLLKHDGDHMADILAGKLEFCYIPDEYSDAPHNDVGDEGTTNH